VYWLPSEEVASVLFFVSLRFDIARRKSEFDIAEITVRLLSDEPTPSGPVPSPSWPPPIKQRIMVKRQSKRLRRPKERGERRRLNITKCTTVKEIKVAVGYQSLHKRTSPLMCFTVAKRIRDPHNLPATIPPRYGAGGQLRDSSVSWHPRQ
jgi:hypothetical protein